MKNVAESNFLTRVWIFVVIALSLSQAYPEEANDIIEEKIISFITESIRSLPDWGAITAQRAAPVPDGYLALAKRIQITDPRLIYKSQERVFKKCAIDSDSKNIQKCYILNRIIFSIARWHRGDVALDEADRFGFLTDAKARGTSWPVYISEGIVFLDKFCERDGLIYQVHNEYVDMLGKYHYSSDFLLP